MATERIRAGDILPGLSAPLRELEGKEIVFDKVTIVERSYKGEPRASVTIHVIEVAGKPVDPTDYHLWQDPNSRLVEGLASFSDEQLANGIVGTFAKVATSGGQTAWTLS
jgi:hypothetical protein